MIIGEQCRAARALLNWSQQDLTKRASISAVSIRAFEKGGNMRASNQKLLRLIFEDAGIEVIDANGGGAGVRFREPFKE